VTTAVSLRRIGENVCERTVAAQEEYGRLVTPAKKRMMHSIHRTCQVCAPPRRPTTMQ